MQLVIELIWRTKLFFKENIFLPAYRAQNLLELNSEIIVSKIFQLIGKKIIHMLSNNIFKIFFFHKNTSEYDLGKNVQNFLCFYSFVYLNIGHKIV